MKRQKMEETKLIEVEEWKVDKKLNSIKIRGIVKYLIQWKRLIAEYDTWEREKDLENTKEAVTKFERRVSAEIRRQEKLKIVEKRKFRRKKLLGKYMAKILYRWDNRKFKEEYLRKLKRNWQK